MKMYGRFFARLLLPGVFLGLVIVAVGAQEGQNTTASPSNETNSSSPFPPTTLSSSPVPVTTLSSSPVPTTVISSTPVAVTTISSSPDSQNQTQEVKSDHGQILYDACNKKQGITCYGDKKNCLKLRSCTFVGAISENDTSINVTVLTRVYDPPYDGVNLTVELSRNVKDSGSGIVCSRPRFKSFKIRLSWKNKTNYEVQDQPGNETQLATTIIDKDQLKNDCMDDQVKNNLTSTPSQTLALKFYILNNNTLVSQGLTHIDVQETTTKPDVVMRNRTGKCLGDLCSPADPPQSQPIKSPKQQQEDILYEMCLKNTAQCFGDTLGCTNGHNCTVLGVIKENRTNYVVYLVTKSYDPPLTDLNVTLTLKAPYSVNSSSNSSSHVNAVKTEGCQRPDFKDLQVQSIWRARDLSQPTNETVIRETVVDKNALRNRCNNDVKNLTSNVTDMGDSMEEAINYYLHFHLENDTLVPGEITSDTEMDIMDISNGTFFIVGQNGTAYLVGENNGVVVPEDSTSSSPNTSVNNASASAHITFFSFISLMILASVVLYSTA